MKTKFDSSGFTIMELMIAISILAIILLLSSMVLIGIGNLYSKGADLANVQDVNRNIVENVISNIQFSGSTLNNGTTPIPAVESYTYGSNNVPVYAYCFGNIRYSYVTGFNLPTGWAHILWLDKISAQGSCAPLNIGQAVPTCPDGTLNCTQPGSGSELVGANMHLATFSIAAYTTQLYGISVGLAFGHQDMFVGSGPSIINGNYQCSSTTGQQYCATSYLTTFADERLSQQ